MSYLRPPSPYETSPIGELPARTPPSRLEIGRVIGLSFVIIRQRWLALGFFLAAYFAIDWTFDAVWPFHYTAGVHDWRIGLGAAVYLAFACLVCFRDAALTAVAVQSSSSVSVWSSIADAARAAARAFPVQAAYLVASTLPEIVQNAWRAWSGVQLPLEKLEDVLLATVLAEAAFGIAVIAAWGVIVPVAIVEGGGLFQAMRRASQLLAGSRWRFVAVFVVINIAATLPEMLAAAFMFPIQSALHLNPTSRDAIRMVFAVTNVLGALVIAIWRVTVALAYLELRRLKEGIVLGEVAGVFD